MPVPPRGRLIVLAATALALAGATLAGAHPLDVLDPDHDGKKSYEDNCPNHSNRFQTDTDGDGQGNTCDTDDDNDGVRDGSDNCPLEANPDQTDNDADEVGDVCEEVDFDPPSVDIRTPSSYPTRSTTLPFGVFCSEKCTLTARVRISAKTARKLGWRSASSPVTIATASGVTDASTRADLEALVSAKARKRLRKATKVSATLHLTAADRDRNTATTKRRLVLKR